MNLLKQEIRLKRVRDESFRCKPDEESFLNKIQVQTLALYKLRSYRYRLVKLSSLKKTWIQSNFDQFWSARETVNRSLVKGIFWGAAKIVPNCTEPLKLFENKNDFGIGKSHYGRMKTPCISERFKLTTVRPFSRWLFFQRI